MLSRFDLRSVLRGHWKGLTNGQYSTYKPDRTSRIVLVIPLILFVVMLVAGGRLRAPTPLLTATALLAGGFLSAFTHLSTLRLKITEWIEEEGNEDKLIVEREMLDETAAHLLTGALLCVLAAVALVAGMNVGGGNGSELVGFWAALVAGLSAYIALIFIIILPRLYSAWVDINHVSLRLSGFSQSRR
jgi:drug/metabolite transporter (DMT)-like permease